MEIIIWLLVIAAIIWFVIHVVAPVAGIVSICVLGAGAIYALYISIQSFATSIQEHINPYTTYVDSNPIAESGVRRGYFFGPGYHQIAVTVKDAFGQESSYVEKVNEWKKEFIGKHKKLWYINAFVWLFYIAVAICVYVFGSIWMSLFSVVLFTFTALGMSLFFIFFSALWVSDRIALFIKSIQSRCPNCKKLSVVPLFLCPACGTEHQKLTPGPYGTLHRRCVCGELLPTTVFNGRSKLEAECPYCHSTLASGGARQFGIQLIGGVSAGKTSYLAAFWHTYLNRLSDLSYDRYSCFPQDAFDELDYWFNEGLSNATSEMNATMYSILYEDNKKTPFQLTIYDVAGESFLNLDSVIQQRQFDYCEALVLVIDPTADPESANETISSFVSEFKRIKGTKASALSSIPVAVVISKADLFKREIGLPKIKLRSTNLINNGSAEDSRTALLYAQEELCRTFLENHDFDSVLNLIDGEFSNVAFFSVSAMGHEPTPGEPYSPWGVVEPILWILDNYKSMQDEKFSIALT